MGGWMDGWRAFSSVNICNFLFVPPPMALFMHFTNLVVIELADLEERELFLLKGLLAMKMRSMYL